MKKNKKGYKSRVQRNRKRRIEILKKKGIKLIKEIIKSTFKNTIYLIVGLVYTIYLLIRAFDNLIVMLFMKLPRWSRVIILWSLVISNIYHNFDFKVLAQETTIISQINTTTIIKTPQIETKVEEVYKCTLEHETACKIQKRAKEYNIDWKIAVAISQWETGNWTSNLYHNKNNVGGLYCNGFLSYKTLDEGIDAYVSNLKRNYFDMGLDTLEEIQKKYCPIGADNDPNNLNKHWLGGVSKIYQSLQGK